MNGVQVAIFKQVRHIALRRLLQSLDRIRTPAQALRCVGRADLIVCNLSDKALESYAEFLPVYSFACCEEYDVMTIISIIMS